MARGHCSCGAVAFEVDPPLGDVYVCHCSICRRSTGSNGVAVLVVPTAQFRWTHGEDRIATWKKPDADWQTWFCRDCGARLPGENNASTVFVPAGLLSEGGEKLRVAHHIFVGSKAPWDVIGDDGKQHVEAFGG